jgi:Sulfotransferase domain
MFLVTTPQRCGSTWLTKMLCGMAKSRDVYINGLRLGFRLTPPSESGAIENLSHFISRRPRVKVFKTHDVAAKDFDEICEAIPDLRILTLHRDFRDVLVSRYFYLRYYWLTEPRLGALPPLFAQFLGAIGAMPDAEALPAMLETPIVEGWAREWNAFETHFTTPHALRVTYTGMLDESEFPRLADFVGLSLRRRRAFEIEQKEETLHTGRDGMARFNRKGRAGEWREWFNEEQGARLSGLASNAP